MEKRKSILDTDQMKRKLAKLSPRERATVKRRIIEDEKWTEKLRKEEEALMRLSKEKRLKAIYNCHLNEAFYHGIVHAMAIREGLFRSREAIRLYEKNSTKQAATGLTLALKKAKVFPLEG